ncbi:MAG: hypothetical protein U0229_00425 [Anaeromyxobacter sp.]
MRTRFPLGGLAAALLAAALAACGSTSLKSSVGFSRPTAVAVFFGVTSKNADVHPYAAVANGARDDLTLIDALDDRPVVSPVLVRALAVPTLSRPAMLVAGSLHDAALSADLKSGYKPDLLAVVPAGSSIVQVVRTWTADNRTVDALEVDLSTAAPGAEILSAVAVPVPLAGSGDPTPGKVRLVLGLTGGRLAVLEYVRDPGDAAGLAIALGAAPVVQAVGFDAVSLAPAPGDARLLYAATPDDLPAGSGNHGVVELQTSAGAGAFTAALLPARGPTRLVAAVRTSERIWADNDADALDAPPALRVFAALDTAGCGPDKAIDCGVVTVDPSASVRGIVPDPMGELPYQPPIRLPAEPIAMLAAIPPSTQPSGLLPGYFNIQTGLGTRETTGAVGVACADGRLYTIDAARRTVHNDQSMLRDLSGTTQTRVRADSVEFFAVTDPPPVEADGETSKVQGVQVAVCTFITTTTNDVPETHPECKLVNTSDAEAGIRVTPGYTRDDQFNLAYQAVLPGLAGRTVDLGSSSGVLTVAFQERNGTAIANVGRVYDPALGVHVGDSVQLAVNGNLSPACDQENDPRSKNTDESVADVHEYTITRIAPPDAGAPGGKLELAGGDACYAALAAQRPGGVTGTVRSSGWLIKGAALGYVGRPPVTTSADGKDLFAHARLAWEDESALTCPLSPWPANPAAVSCDADCRDRCERLSIARKVRRWYTVPDSCDNADAAETKDTGCTSRWGGPTIVPGFGTGPSFPSATEGPPTSLPPNAYGPFFDFWFTVRQRNVSKAGAVTIDYPSLPINRDTGMNFNTHSGHAPTVRYPLTGSIVMPTGLAAFDRSPWDSTATYRFWVSYTGDFALDFSPGLLLNAPVTIR